MHPGELLREEVLPALGWPEAAIARALGLSGAELSDVLGERQPVTPAIARRLGRMLGNGPRLWLNLQRAHDHAMALRTRL
jgi:addiction module HigA family antidote